MSSISEPPPLTPEQVAAWEAAQAEAERELALADAAAAQAVAVAVPPPLPPRRAPGAVWFLLPVVLAAAAGTASVLLKPKPEPEPVVEKPKVTVPEPLRPGDLEAIDTYVRAGCYADALQLCRDATGGAPADRRALAYREALCWEALGHLSRATAAFKLAEPPEGDVAAWARAVLGQARCACAGGDLQKAEALLHRAYLRSGHPECAGARVAEECLFLRARFDALRAPVRPLDPFDADALAWPSLAPPVDRYHEWLVPASGPARSAAVVANEFEARRAPAAPGGFEVTAQLAERAPIDVLRALAGALKVPLTADAATVAALSKEPAAVNVRGAALADFLRALVGRFGCAAALDDGALVVWKGESVAPDRGAVLAGFARVLALSDGEKPPHPLELAARVWHANLLAQEGRAGEARAAYQKAIEAGLSAPEVVHATYNVGLLELRAGSFAFARSRFNDLIDRAPRTHWVDYAWWWLARAHLDTANFAEARRALALARSANTTEVASAALLALATCELLDGKTAAASDLLFDTRVAAREDHALLLAAYEALFRYRRAPTPSRKAAVLDALARCGDGRALGPAGAFLFGGFYRELDRPERAAALYDSMSDGHRGPLVVRMTFDAGEWYALAGDAPAARQRLLAVAVLDPKGLGPRAELRLADLELRDGRAAECVRRCRALAARPEAPRADVLALMGKAYEVQKNYRAAAECYGGKVPQ
jgi:tetratricopeptide (TPR) repeat protein